MRRSHGFTLIEMLVVISLIVLLISMVVPSMSAARQRANTVKCTTQLSQISRASDAFSVDNNGYVPRDHWYNCLNPSSIDYRHFSFLGRYSGYVGGPSLPLEADTDPSNTRLYEAAQSVEIWRCPSETKTDYALTYVANGVDFEYYRENGSYVSSAMSRIESLPGSPSQIMHMAEANTINFHNPRDLGVYDVFTPTSFIYHNGSPTFAPRMMSAQDRKHGTSVPILFFDHHVETLSSNRPEQFPITMFNPLDVK